MDTITKQTNDNAIKTGFYAIINNYFDFSRYISVDDIFFCVFSKKIENSQKNLQILNKSFENKVKLSEYRIGQDLEYLVEISKISSLDENFYEINLDLPKEQRDFIDNFGDFVISELKKNNYQDLKPFNELLEDLKQQIAVLIENKIFLGFYIFPSVILRLIMNALQISTIFPFLLDENVEEIFCDSENNFLYLNHRLLGRCRTFYRISSVELNSLITLIQVDGNLRFDYVNCKLIHTISNPLFTCRFSFDRQPIHPNICFDIRKMKRTPFKLSEL